MPRSRVFKGPVWGGGVFRLEIGGVGAEGIHGFSTLRFPQRALPRPHGIHAKSCWRSSRPPFVSVYALATLSELPPPATRGSHVVTLRDGGAHLCGGGGDS